MNKLVVAEQILRYHFGHSLSLPDGVHYLDSGWSRATYRMANLVYKIEDSVGVNRQEYENFLYLQNLSLPGSWRLPNFELIELSYAEVIVSDYIKGSPAPWCGPRVCECYQTVCIWNSIVAFQDFTGIPDVTCNNVLINTEGMWAIDLGA